MAEPTLFRSLLSVPALQQRFVDKASTVPTDAIVFDLEDSIAPADKPAARDRLRTVLPAFPHRGRTVLVRPNGLDTGLLEQDLDAVVGPGIHGVFLPKVHTDDVVVTADTYISYLERVRDLPDGGICLVVWIESTEGVARAEAICRSSPRLVAAAFGAEDYVTDLGIQRRRDSVEIAYQRSRVANAARAAGLWPIDCPEPDYRDNEHFETDSRRARILGYRGKFCIHPDQVALANHIFAPSDDELAWAREVVDAYEAGTGRGLGAVGLHGVMVDRPVYLRAAGLLEQQARIEDRNVQLSAAIAVE